MPSDSDSLDQLFDDIMAKHKRKPIEPALRDAD